MFSCLMCSEARRNDHGVLAVDGKTVVTAVAVARKALKGVTSRTAGCAITVYLPSLARPCYPLRQSR